MDLFAIEIKKYKIVFFQTLIINLASIAGSYLLVNNGVYYLLQYEGGKKLTLPILSVMVILAALHSRYQKKELIRLSTIDDFDKKIDEYERFYKFRMIWFFFSCLISCILSVFSNQYLFLCYAGFDVLISLQFYPTLKRFKRDLQNEEIIFY